MNLVIDIGNSQTKVAVFDAGEIVHTISTRSLDAIQLGDLKRNYPGISHAILSSVADKDLVLLKALTNEYRFFLEFSHHTPIPIENLYESKTTLGLDRLAAAVGGTFLFPAKDLLIIDAGTAITYDVIDCNNRFLGGNISPGLSMRFKALNRFTKKLPEIASNNQWPEIGNTTENAIRAGVQQGIIFEMDGMIEKIRRKWPFCEVILTGGDSLFFEKKLKNTIFVKSDLTLIGLSRILEYNVNKNICE